MWEINDVFLLEPFFIEETADFRCLNDIPERLCLCLQIAAFEAEYAVGKGVLVLLGDVFLHDFDEVGQWHDSSADHKIVEAFFVFTTQMGGLAVLQSNSLAYFLSDTDFLSCTVDELELAVREEYGQRDAWETAARAEVEDSGAFAETDDLGDGHRMKYMVLVEIVDILAGDDVDFVIPIAIEGIEGFYLLMLL